MKIIVDADACPKPIKDILFRCSTKRKIKCILVANQNLTHPISDFISSIRVNKGFDVADDYIVKISNKDDLIITSDIPLANEVIKKGASVISHKGKKYTMSNIGQALAMRNFFTEMRESGLVETKNKAYSSQNSQAFASALESYLNNM